MMVNDIQCYDPYTAPTVTENDRTKIWNPDHTKRSKQNNIYDLAKVQQHLKSNPVVTFVTDRARRDSTNLNWDAKDVSYIIQLLEPKRYRGSEMCDTSPKKGDDDKTYTLACDSYVIFLDEDLDEDEPEARFGIGTTSCNKYFVKFGCNPNKNEICINVTSCHT